MPKTKKKQLDLSEVGEPIENSLQTSEASLDLSNIINDSMLPVKKDIDNLEIEKQEQPAEQSVTEKNQHDNAQQEDNGDNGDNGDNEYDDYDDDYDYDDNYSDYDDGDNNDNNDNNNDINNTADSTDNIEPQDINVLHAQQLVTKRDLVHKIQQLQQRLYDVEISPKTFTTADSLTELQAEYDRLYRLKQQKSTREWYRKILFGVTKGIEWANHQWDPVGLKLDGWSTEVASNVDEFDEIFDELAEKYGGSINEKIAPEIRLVLLILYSGVSYSISQTLVQDHSNRPEFTEIINKDPVLRERFMRAATEVQMDKAQPQVSQLLSSVKELFTDKQPQTQQQSTQNMRNFMTRLDDSELNVNELGL